MIRWLRGWLRGETVRYILFGALTVVVNTGTFKLLGLVMDELAANTVAFFAAILVAYWTNSTFVFRVPHTWKNFLEFFGMRAGTLLLDDGGMFLLLRLGVNDLVSKCIVNAAVICVNYLSSKLVVFRKSQ